MNFPLPIFATRSSASRTDTTVSERTGMLVMGTILAICTVGIFVVGLIFTIFIYEMFKAPSPSEAHLAQICAEKGGSLRTIVGAKAHYTGCVVPLN